MVAKSHSRGNLIEYTNSHWVYSETKKSIKKEMPCKRCNRLSTKEGYDACLGYIEGVSSACCGHGVTRRIIKLDN